MNNFKHAGMGKRAYELLQRLQDAFPDCYQREDSPSESEGTAGGGGGEREEERESEGPGERHRSLKSSL